MHDILDALLQTNIALAASICVVTLLRRPVRLMFGAQSAYALWLLVPAAALATLLPARTIQVAATIPNAAPLHASGFDISAPLLTIWAAGAVVLMFCMARAQRRFQLAVDLAGLARPWQAFCALKL